MAKEYHLFFGDAVLLRDGISNRSGGLRINDSEKSRLLESLLLFSVSQSNTLFKNFPNSADYKTSLEESEILYSLSFRRLFLNKNISKQLLLSPLENVKLRLMKKIRAYSSDLMLKMLMQEPALIESMRKSESRYSILAKLRIQDKENTTLRPFFIIPGSDGNQISFLEEMYQKSYPNKRLFGLIPSRKETRMESLYDTL